MAKFTEADRVNAVVYEAKADIIAVLQKLMADLSPEYIVTGCDVSMGTVELTGGGKRVYLDGVNITVEVTPTTTPPPPAP